MSSQFKKFKALHQADSLFVLPNVWNAKSAMVFQEKQFQAVGTSSAAVASSLGYEDGEQMQFSDYLFVIGRVLASVKIPVTVDLETGYGRTNDEIAANVVKLADMGVAGINIEDSVISGSKRSLQKADTFAKTVEAIKNALEKRKTGLFVNIRCDTYILDVKNKQQETAARLEIYGNTGADGIFLPCISHAQDITEALNNTSLPLNVMCIPGLPCLDTLNGLGVKRASMGPFLFNKVYTQAGELSQAVLADKSFAPLFS
ncbi:isocitrate lyase/PEP mutase family protein [Fulvivirgaceae bacterium PWU4]|uniref:Isocitrate lyase/PEP mutase family protein n=1 Tax=Chryseosolibacter histidini TaxID=2782349 RepID=A0AAP2DI75_9BACT|nr:isocitrate lyase/phosphoenolpyruvate mutase family protein [Chryseosolibacter histidini]MBT1696630.1 isocitrate lyase/PEP mutase family protein [Chryseosolibacter histidini]